MQQYQHQERPQDQQGRIATTLPLTHQMQPIVHSSQPAYKSAAHFQQSTNDFFDPPASTWRLRATQQPSWDAPGFDSTYWLSNPVSDGFLQPSHAANSIQDQRRSSQPFSHIPNTRSRSRGHSVHSSPAGIPTQDGGHAPSRSSSTRGGHHGGNRGSYRGSSRHSISRPYSHNSSRRQFPLNDLQPSSLHQRRASQAVDWIGLGGPEDVSGNSWQNATHGPHFAVPDPLPQIPTSSGGYPIRLPCDDLLDPQQQSQEPVISSDIATPVLSYDRSTTSMYGQISRLSDSADHPLPNQNNHHNQSQHQRSRRHTVAHNRAGPRRRRGNASPQYVPGIHPRNTLLQPPSDNGLNPDYMFNDTQSQRSIAFSHGSEECPEISYAPPLTRQTSQASSIFDRNVYSASQSTYGDLPTSVPLSHHSAQAAIAFDRSQDLMSQGSQFDVPPTRRLNPAAVPFHPTPPTITVNNDWPALPTSPQLDASHAPSSTPLSPIDWSIFGRDEQYIDPQPSQLGFSSSAFQNPQHTAMAGQSYTQLLFGNEERDSLLNDHEGVP